jgi:hypothetical protein
MLPDKIAKDIIAEAVNWNEGREFRMADFLRQYTLHDSHWFGLFGDTAWSGGATAIIGFDPIWNNVGLVPTSLCADWPILLIRFPGIVSINIAKYDDIGGLQRGISGTESEEVAQGLTMTLLTDHYGGEVTIVHQDPVKVLCFSSSGEPINLKTAS